LSPSRPGETWAQPAKRQSSRHPESTRALQVHAIAHAELGNRNLARESLEKLLSKNPEDWVQLGNLGRLEMAAGTLVAGLFGMPWTSIRGTSRLPDWPEPPRTSGIEPVSKERSRWSTSCRSNPSRWIFDPLRWMRLPRVARRFCPQHVTKYGLILFKCVHGFEA
jgi:hypothetical protein